MNALLTVVWYAILAALAGWLYWEGVGGTPILVVIVFFGAAFAVAKRI